MTKIQNSKTYDLEDRTLAFAKNVRAFYKRLSHTTINIEDGKQLIKASGSIGANYIEAQASSSKKDFANFFHHSLKSANETKFWLALCRDLNKGEKSQAEALLQELTEIANILGSSLLTLKGKK